MAEAFVNVTEGSGKKLHGWDRTVGANSVVDEFVIPGQYPYATYIAFSSTTSIATANDHIMQLMAGASLNLYVRRIRVEQVVAITTASIVQFQLYRLTTAGTGGTAITPRPTDSTDAAAGATAMTLPTAKGTEGVLLDTRATFYMQTQPVAGGQSPYVEWTWTDNEKGIRIPAGTANGIAIKQPSSRPGASAIVTIEFVELNY